MPKKVNVKRVSKEEKMQGAVDEMVVGRMTTRALSKNARHDLMSCSEFKLFEKWAKQCEKVYSTDDEKIKRFHIWRSNKEWADAKNAVGESGGMRFGLNFFSDLTDSECTQFYGTKYADDPYRGNLQTPEFYDSTYGKQVAEEEAAFGMWVAQKGKKYGSTCEREDRFALYFQNKKMIEALMKENSSCSFYPLELDNNMDQIFDRSMLKNLLNGSAPSKEGWSAPSNYGWSAPSKDGCTAPIFYGWSAPIN